MDPLRLMAANATLVGLSWGSQYPWRAAAVEAAYQELFDMCASGAVRPPVSRLVSLDETPAALTELAERRTTGKIIVRIDEGEGP
ncbi:zinc-binding dehydrogenase [Micromonospora sp. BRA006-A]|nr:zinc-binding dehydrogenase [Micromonospora sp. BRA006-A]